MTRFQFELTDEKDKELEALMAEVGMRTKKEVFNNALTLLEWAVKERKAGRVIASVDDQAKMYEEILMPILVEEALRICRS